METTDGRSDADGRSDDDIVGRTGGRRPTGSLRQRRTKCSTADGGEQWEDAMSHRIDASHCAPIRPTWSSRCWTCVFIIVFFLVWIEVKCIALREKYRALGSRDVLSESEYIRVVFTRLACNHTHKDYIGD